MVNVKAVLTLLVAGSFFASYAFPGIGPNATIENLITFIGILFGVMVGFFITDLYARFQAIRQNAAIDAGALHSYYSFSRVLSSNKKNKGLVKSMSEAIEKYIRTFMPIPWEEYAKTERRYGDITKIIEGIDVATMKENAAYTRMLAAHYDHATAREKLVMYGKGRLTRGEWVVVFSLAIVLLASLFYVKDTSMISVLFTGFLSSAILILIFVLKDLNNLNFGESAVSIEPYERVLDAIGRPRYYKRKEEPALAKSL